MTNLQPWTPRHPQYSRVPTSTVFVRVNARVRARPKAVPTVGGDPSGSKVNMRSWIGSSQRLEKLVLCLEDGLPVDVSVVYVNN